MSTIERPLPPELDADYESVAEAASCADHWYETACGQIDYYNGDGFAAQNPLLVVGFMLSAAVAYHADRQRSAGGLVADALRETNNEIAESRSWLVDCAGWIEAAINGMGGGGHG